MIPSNIKTALREAMDAHAEYMSANDAVDVSADYIVEKKDEAKDARAALVAAIGALVAEKERAVAALVATVEFVDDAQLVMPGGLYVSPIDCGTFEVFGKGPRVEYGTAREAVEAALKEAK